MPDYSGSVPLRAQDLRPGMTILTHSKSRKRPTPKLVRRIMRTDAVVTVWYDGSPLLGERLPATAEVMACNI